MVVRGSSRSSTTTRGAPCAAMSSMTVTRAPSAAASASSELRHPPATGDSPACSLLWLYVRTLTSQAGSRS